MWVLDVCDDWNKIGSTTYQKQWMNLLENASNPHVFFHPDLVQIWIKTYLPLQKHSPLFIWGKETESGNELFMPLILWQRNWKNAFLRIIVPAGFSDYDYHDPITKYKVDDMTPLWGTIINLLKKYSADSILINGIRDYNIDNLHSWTKDEPCPYLELSNIVNENDLMAFLKTGLRGDIRRQIRRLNEMGDIVFKEYTSYEEVKQIFPIFLEEHSLKWPNSYKAPNFHEYLLKDGLNSIVHFSSLNIKDEIIACHLGFEYKDTYYYYMPIGMHKYAKYSPTKIHLYYLINRAINKRLKIFDHLRGEENYKLGWSNGMNYINNLTIDNTSFISQFKIQTNHTVRSLINSTRY